MDGPVRTGKCRLLAVLWINVSGLRGLWAIGLPGHHFSPGTQPFSAGGGMLLSQSSAPDGTVTSLLGEEPIWAPSICQHHTGGTLMQRQAQTDSFWGTFSSKIQSANHSVLPSRYQKEAWKEKVLVYFVPSKMNAEALPQAKGEDKWTEGGKKTKMEARAPIRTWYHCYHTGRAEVHEHSKYYSFNFCLKEIPVA